MCFWWPETVFTRFLFSSYLDSTTFRSESHILTSNRQMFAIQFWAGGEHWDYQSLFTENIFLLQEETGLMRSASEKLQRRPLEQCAEICPNTSHGQWERWGWSVAVLITVQAAVTLNCLLAHWQHGNPETFLTCTVHSCVCCSCSSSRLVNVHLNVFSCNIQHKIFTIYICFIGFSSIICLLSNTYSILASNMINWFAVEPFLLPHLDVKYFCFKNIKQQDSLVCPS